MPEHVYIRLTRPEGYEDVDDELVMEDALDRSSGAFLPVVVDLADLVRDERRDCLEWIRAHAQICGCSERIEKSIRERGTDAEA